MRALVKGIGGAICMAVVGFGIPKGIAQDSGSRALNGSDAANFILPGDVTLLRSTRLAKYGLTYER